MSYIQQIEDADYEANANHDYIREAHYGLGDDAASLAGEMEAIAREEDLEYTAAFGPRVCAPARSDYDDIPF